jgi:hypothetical protein
VQCGAGLKLGAECYMGHKTSFQTCDFYNQNRTSALDVKISVLQLVTGLSMSQECLHEIYLEKNNLNLAVLRCVFSIFELVSNSKKNF